MKYNFWVLPFAIIVAFLFVGRMSGNHSDIIKIGFIVKRPSEKWFKYELTGAQKAADKLGIELLQAGGSDAEQALNAVNSLIARGVKGIIICTPEVKLGRAIRTLTDRHGVKLFTVDDRFENADGSYINDVPYLGISVEQVGKLIADYMYEQVKQRQWSSDDTALCTLSYNPLKTSRMRVRNVAERLITRGFTQSNIHMIDQAGIDQRYAYKGANELISKHPEVKNWLVCGFNDQSAIGAVRAMEAYGITAKRGIAIGINGLDAARIFVKGKNNALSASVLLNPYKHGYLSMQMMYMWIKNGTIPPGVTLTSGEIIDRINYKDKLEELYQQQEAAGDKEITLRSHL